MHIFQRMLTALATAALLPALLGPTAAAQTGNIHVTPQQEAKIKKLESRLMAPCCYTQTIREHESEVAEQMREEVTAMVVSGKSEEEIITYYRTKYGETILVVPDGMTGLLLTYVPISLFLAALGALLIAIHKSVQSRKILITDRRPAGVDAEVMRLRDRIRTDISESW